MKVASSSKRLKKFQHTEAYAGNNSADRGNNDTCLRVTEQNSFLIV